MHLLSMNQHRMKNRIIIRFIFKEKIALEWKPPSWNLFFSSSSRAFSKECTPHILSLYFMFSYCDFFVCICICIYIHICTSYEVGVPMVCTHGTCMGKLDWYVIVCVFVFVSVYISVFISVFAHCMRLVCQLCNVYTWNLYEKVRWIPLNFPILFMMAKYSASCCNSNKMTANKSESHLFKLRLLWSLDIWGNGLQKNFELTALQKYFRSDTAQCGGGGGQGIWRGGGDWVRPCRGGGGGEEGGGGCGGVPGDDHWAPIQEWNQGDVIF